jgi:DUF1365 family protein
MTLGVIAGIHWEAFKLVLKGARYHRHGPERLAPGTSLGRDITKRPDWRGSSDPAV